MSSSRSSLLLRAANRWSRRGVHVHRLCYVSHTNLGWRFCTASSSTSGSTVSSHSDTEVMSQLKLMQKQLNQVHRQTKKSKWKYLFGLLYFTPFIIVYGLLFSFWKDAKKEIVQQKNAYKVINIVCSGIHSTSNPELGSFLSDTSHSIPFLKLKKCIECASKDDTVLGISLIMDNATEIGYAHIQELREELKRFKLQSEGKRFILSYGKSVDMKEYLLSTICDESYLMECATLNIYGFAFPNLFFKKLLQKIGVQPYVLKREKYKNFADMFTEEEMSKEHRESLLSLGNDLYSQFLNIVYKTLSFQDERYETIDDVAKIVDNAPYVANEAIDRGLVTDTIHWKDYQMRLSLLGYNQIAATDQEQDEEPDILLLSPKEYLRSYEFVEDRKKKKRSFWKFLKRESVHDDGTKRLNKPKHVQTSQDGDGSTESETETNFEKKHVALIHIAGEIRSGESEGTVCGSDTIEELVRTASSSDDVIAILLRIDSPGGDAVASESIWNTVFDAKLNCHKPIVVSMGDVCASGGYYIASAADKIFALPATITGSIGVVMLTLSINELLTEKLNINYDQSIKFGENSDIMLPFEPPSEKIQERFETMIDSLYEIFMDRVSTGRDLDMDYVRQLAQGKVYTGQQALQIGLVDQIGGLTEAQLAAQELAGFPVDRPLKLVKYASKMEKLMDLLDGFSDTVAINAKYQHLTAPVLSQFASLLKLKVWLNSMNCKFNDLHTLSNEPKPYYMCLDFLC